MNWSNSSSEYTEQEIKCILRGTWKVIHKTGAWCSDPRIRPFFGPWIRYQVDHLVCQKCAGHGKEYIKHNPPEHEDPSVWCWRFHNDVNRRLGKDDMTWPTYRNEYITGSKTCGNCGQ